MKGTDALSLAAHRVGRGNHLPELIGPREPWMAEALCAQVDPDLWFPESGGSTREAKRICQGCAVRQECLRYAVDRNERFGIWGGMSERQRRRWKRGETPPPTVMDGIPGARDPHVHGFARYRKGCRCNICRAAIALYQRRYKAKQRTARSCRVCGGQVQGQGRSVFCSTECRRKSRRVGERRYA